MPEIRQEANKQIQWLYRIKGINRQAFSLAKLMDNYENGIEWSGNGNFEPLKEPQNSNIYRHFKQHE